MNSGDGALWWLGGEMSANCCGIRGMKDFTVCCLKKMNSVQVGGVTPFCTKPPARTLFSYDSVAPSVLFLTNHKTHDFLVCIIWWMSMIFAFVVHPKIWHLAQPLWMTVQSGTLSSNIPATRAARNLALQVSSHPPVLRKCV